MKFIKLFLVGLMLSSCSSKPTDTVRMCAHPAINFGTPFTLDKEDYFTTNGSLVHKNGDTTITLLGAVCISKTTPRAE